MKKRKHTAGGVHQMNPRQARFVREYLKDRNATRAYRAVYKCTPQVAHANGARLLTNASVRAKISNLVQKDADKLDLSREKVLRAYSNIAFGDLRELFAWSENGIRVKNSNDLSADQAARLDSIQVEQIEIDVPGGDGEKVPAMLKKIKITPQSRLSALQALGRHFGIFNDKIQLSGRLGTVNLTSAIPEPDLPPATE